MARYGQAASEEIRQSRLARDDLRDAIARLAPNAPDTVIASFMNALDRMVECKLAERKLY